VAWSAAGAALTVVVLFATAQTTKLLAQLTEDIIQIRRPGISPEITDRTATRGEAAIIKAATLGGIKEDGNPGISGLIPRHVSTPFIVFAVFTLHLSDCSGVGCLRSEYFGFQQGGN
jgi:hypothetical protein